MSDIDIELHPQTLRIDEKLEQLEDEIDWLSRLTPTNISAIWTGFCESGFKEAPAFEYDPLPDNLTEMRRDLFALHFHDFDSPMFEALLIEKQRELDRQIELIRFRDQPGFVLASLDLFGNVADNLLSAARTIRDEVPIVDAGPRDADADAVIACAEEEMRAYRERSPDFRQKVVKNPNPGTQLVTVQGDLHVACDYEIERGRIIPLLSHEIGTHSVTRHNGRMQPLRVLECGLADYDRMQEGLAVLAEYLCGYLPPARLRVLAARVEAAHMAISEASMAQIFACLYEDYKLDEHSAFHTALRAKRGGGLTKDAVYLRGIMEVMAYLANDGDFEILFVGKFALKQLHTLEKLIEEGLLLKPDLLPRYLDDLDAMKRLDRVRSLDITRLYQETPES